MDEPCPVCGGTGLILSEEDGVLYSRPCQCLAVRASRRRIERSGLGDLFEAASFKAFQTPDEWTKKALDTAWDYARNGRGKWMYIAGRPGTGKTHLCTAVCRYLLEKGASVRYMVWREDAPRLKALINDAEAYEEAFRELANAKVLYVDDFFKGSVTDADVNLAFSLLNARYNQKAARTILSSERPLKEIISIDEATGSRIREKAQGYTLFAPPDAKNWREK